MLALFLACASGLRSRLLLLLKRCETALLERLGHEGRSKGFNASESFIGDRHVLCGICSTTQLYVSSRAKAHKV